MSNALRLLNCIVFMIKDKSSDYQEEGGDRVVIHAQPSSKVVVGEHVSSATRPSLESILLPFACPQVFVGFGVFRVEGYSTPEF